MSIKVPRIVEMLPRDGLQTMVHEGGWRAPTTADKVAFIRLAAEAGIPEIEVTGFVHPASVPPLADAAQVVEQTADLRGVVLRALVPNFKGALRAIDAGVQKLSCLVVASETYQRKNSNMSIKDNKLEIERIVKIGRDENRIVSAGIGICFACPYEGRIPLKSVIDLIDFVVTVGIDEVSIADSIGYAGPTEVRERVDAILQRHPDLTLGLHLHDSTGMALANIYAGWLAGATVFESCTGGYGGGIAMPVSVNSMGNVATEDVVNLFNSIGVSTGIDLEKVRRAGAWFSELIGVEPRSRIARNGTLEDLNTIGRRHMQDLRAGSTYGHFKELPK
ncbi:hydroxymethylglutaryl-CoA lyase [Aminobacter sp. MSH1]|uniref:hydroxymethylglutaryl-CoA lyase n=1 Tax=Aminobacter sp. MSH1 TaxID=374606 RepID=UPI000D38938B|nr:hydroxymethylglutaryl-CoA lyase [Aminobacter sp. MSH1]